MRVVTIDEREWKLLIQILETVPPLSIETKADRKARTRVLRKLKEARRAGEFYSK